MPVHHLSTDQKQILIRLVQAERSMPRAERRAFLALQTASNNNLIVSHPGLGTDRLEVYPEDLRAIASLGLVHVSESRILQFDLTESGRRAYELIQKAHSNSVVPVEQELIRYMDDPGFRKRHPSAHEKWQAAAHLLWAGEVAVQLTQIGHLCREASRCLPPRYSPCDQ